MLLRQIAGGLLQDAYRANGRRSEVSLEGLIGRDGTGLDDWPQFQTYDFEDSDFAAEFDRAVRVLDPIPRDAFILAELRGLTSREIAPLIGVSHTTAAAHRELATTSIRKELAYVR